MGPIIIVGLALLAVALLMPGKKKVKPEMAVASAQQFQQPQVVYAQPEAPREAPRRFSIRQQQIEEAAEVLAEEFSRAEDDAFRDAVRRKAATYFAADALPAK